jgi:diacylglycerol kinase family enzyme
VPGIGVILNPDARGNRRARERAARFEAIVGPDGDVACTATLAALDEALARFQARGIDVLAVCGGDGSVQTAITRALAVWPEARLPLLLPLRGGTINNLSRSIGPRRRRAERMLAHVVADFRRGHAHDTVEGDLILVNGQAYAHTVGAAMMVSFLRLYYAGNEPTPLRAYRLMVRLGLSYFLSTSLIRSVAKPIEADVTCDGERLPFRQYTMLIAGTMPHIGLGVRPFYLGGRKRGFFHLLAGPCTPGELLARLPRFLRGLPAELPSLYDNVACRVRIEFAEPQCFTINGDIPEEPVRVLELEAGPRIRLIRG